MSRTHRNHGLSRDDRPLLMVQEVNSTGYGVSIEVTEVVLQTNTEHQHVLIAETNAFGRVLFLDGLVQSAESDEEIYHETYVHPATFAHGDVKRVLIGGTGEGAILREVLKHPGVEKVVCVDVDREVVEACMKHLGKWHQGAFEDARVELQWRDINEALEDFAPGEFDLVIMDVTEPVEGGPAEELFSAAFFDRVKRVMGDHGVLVVQAGEIDPWGMEQSRYVVAELEKSFGYVQLAHCFVPSFMAQWGAAICSKHADFVMLPGDLAARIDAVGRENFLVYDEVWHQACTHLPRLLERRLRE